MKPINDRQRVEMGLIIDVLSRTMLPLKEFQASPQGQLVVDLLARAAGEVKGPLSDKEIVKHRRRVHRESDTILHTLKLGPDETHFDDLQSFNAAIAFSYEAIKLGVMPLRGRVGYMQLSTFIEKLVAPDHDLSVMGESINDARVRTAGQAMLGVAMSRGYYRA